MLALGVWLLGSAAQESGFLAVQGFISVGWGQLCLLAVGWIRFAALLVLGDVTPGRWVLLLGPRCQGSQQVLSESLLFCFQCLVFGDEGFEDLSVVGAKHLLIVMC